MPITRSQPFELWLFHKHLEFDLAALAAGVQGLVVDWENRGKSDRQRSYDTQINSHSEADLRLLRQATPAPIICRLNSPGPSTGAEIESAIALGATEVLLPMIESVAEVREALALIGGRCGCAIMLETNGAVAAAPELARLPLSRIYVGLNDLSIQRRERHLFVPLADGTVEQVRPVFDAIPFGFGGLTLPNLGQPLPCRLLISEMIRLGTHFAFLRRSFMRDVEQSNLAQGVRALQAALQAAPSSAETAGRDHAELVTRIAALPDPPWHRPV